jgi:hypothetical protein
MSGKRILLNGRVVSAPDLCDYLDSLLLGNRLPPAVFVDKRLSFNQIKSVLNDVYAKAPETVPSNVRALFAWWTEAADHAGNGVFVDMTATLASMFAAHETPAGLKEWCALLGVIQSDVPDFIRERSTEFSAMTSTWSRSWDYTSGVAREGWLRTHQSSAAMASSMQSMMAAGEWYTGRGLTSDPLLQEAAMWTGYVASGVWVKKAPSEWTFAIGNSSFRHRADSELTLKTSVGTEVERTILVVVRGVSYDPVLGVLVTVHADGKPNNARELDRLFIKDEFDRSQVLAYPREPKVDQAADAARTASQQRNSADGRSWFNDASRKPKGSKNEVPWDVYMGAVGV